MSKLHFKRNIRENIEKSNQVLATTTSMMIGSSPKWGLSTEVEDTLAHRRNHRPPFAELMLEMTTIGAGHTEDGAKSRCTPSVRRAREQSFNPKAK